MQVVNNVQNTEVIEFEELKKFKFNNLKDSVRDVEKLAKSIEVDGFISPIFIYEKENYVIDGQGRYLALLELQKKGWEVKSIPIVKIKAKDLKTAKKIVLAINSKHGEITGISLDLFLVDFNKIELQELAMSEISMPELDLKLGLITPDHNDKDIDFDNISSNENREKSFKNQLVSCPACDNKFNIQM